MFKKICLLLSSALVCCMAEYRAEYGVGQRNDLFNGNGGTGAATAKILSYQFDNIGTGPYRFAFSTSDGIEREEEGNLNNPNTDHEALVVRGSYSYPGPDGVIYTVRYTADENGFHPEGDHIKVPPYVPWNKDQQQEDQSGYYNQNAAVQQQPIVPIYLPGAQGSSISSQTIYGSSNTPKPSITKFVPTTSKPLSIKNVKTPLIQIISTTSKPQSFSSRKEHPSLTTFISTRKGSGSVKDNTGFQGSRVANSILELLGETEKEDNSSTVKIEEINSL